MRKKATDLLMKLGLVIGLMLGAICLCSCKKETLPANEYTPVSCHTWEQANYLADNYRNFKLYANGTEELSVPAPVIIGMSGIVADYAPIYAPGESDDEDEDEEYDEDENVAEPVIVHDYGSAFVLKEDLKQEKLTGIHEVQIATNQDFSDARVAYVSDDCARFYNLLLGTTYYCRINSAKKNGEVFTFTTSEQAPRNLYVDGVTNVRDMGGWPIENGGRVKQGMLIRSSKFNADESDELMITQDGIWTMTEELKVRTEIDLRVVDNNENGGITKSPLGDGVKYISIPFVSGGNILLLNKDSFAELFSVLGNEANYPIVFHCSIGTDRTGAVAFLVNGLMGVSKEDLYRDFLFSNFGEIGSMRTPSIIKTYYDTVDMSAGSSLSEKIYNYLVGCGVDAQDLDSLIRILKED